MDSPNSNDILTGLLQLQAAYDEFVINMKVRDLRPATFEYYHQEIERGFFNFTRIEGVEYIHQVTPSFLRKYLLCLAGRRSKVGVHDAYRALRAWFRWTWMEYDLEIPNPFAKVVLEAPKRERKKGISIDDVRKLLDACRGRYEKRDRFLVLFLIDTGIRRNEICELNIGNIIGKVINLDSDQTKTGEPRINFLNTDTRKAMKDYLATRKDVTGESPLFAAKGGGRFTPMGLYQVIRRLSKDTGVTMTGLHSFRRTFAVETYRETHDLLSTSRLLGHSDTETTKIYLKQIDDDLEIAHRSTNLAAKVLRKK